MYLVVRRALDRDGKSCGDQMSNDTGSRVPLKLFADRTAADTFANQLAAEARRTMNPFHLLDLSVEKPLRAKLRALKLPVKLPEEHWEEKWRAWWDQCVDVTTDDQRAAVWKVLGASLPFEVIEIELE